MTDDQGVLNERGAEIVARINDRLQQQVELDAEQQRAVVAALIEALIGGVRLGAAEVSAQAIEHGCDVRLDLVITNEELQPDDIDLP